MVHLAGSACRLYAGDGRGPVLWERKGKDGMPFNQPSMRLLTAQEFALKDKKFWNSFTFWKGHFLGSLCKQRYQHHQQNHLDRYHQSPHR
mmetsp:Transcript_26423/g.85554  ORF Transcript_26423/g.85554 Transcript_26423/m.85554 type:complete len:90 (-) Transcript_26423:3831-4100(-)